MTDYYFLSCLLPPLPETPGEKMPLSFSAFSGIVRRNIHPDDESLLTSHLSVIDAANWEQYDQGREIFTAGGNLNREDMEARRNLPFFIREFMEEKERGIRRPHVYDRLWELCYRELMAEAGRKDCRFLLDYISWEIALRNRLSALRLRERGGGAEEHFVLPLTRSADLAELIAQIEGLKNPLDAERRLDGERLKRISQCQGNSPFSLDALLAFLARAMIYGRWERMQEPYDMNRFLYGGG